MVIRKPMLPPKSGYVEVEVDGKRTYMNAITGVLIENEAPIPTPTTTPSTGDVSMDELAEAIKKGVNSI